MPMNYRGAVNLIKQYGGVFSGHGARHDEFTMPDGTKIQVPRHKGDFTVGVEKDIQKKVAGKR